LAGMKTLRSSIFSTLFLCAANLFLSRGDLVECINGDRYNGKVVSVDESSVKVQSEITGVLTLPRAKVSSIHFGASPKMKASTESTNQTASPAEVLRKIEKDVAEATGETKPKEAIDP